MIIENFVTLMATNLSDITKKQRDCLNTLLQLSPKLELSPPISFGEQKPLNAEAHSK